MANDAEPILKESNPWAISVRLKHYNTSTTSFQIAHDFRDGAQPEYVDGERSHLNSGARGPTALEYRDLMLERRKLTAPRRAPMLSRVAVMTGGIITFGHLAQIEILKLSIEQQDALYAEIGTAIAERLGNELTAWAAHRDESAPHAHLEFPSRRSSDGMLMSEYLKPSMTSELQDIAAGIAQKYAPKIQRGEKKEKTKARNKSVRELHRSEAVDLAARRAKLDDLTVLIKAAETKIEQNKARAKKAQEKADQNDKKAAAARKLVVTYERRAQSAQDDLEKLQRQVADLRAIETALTEAKAKKQRELSAIGEAVAQKKTKKLLLMKKLTALNET